VARIELVNLRKTYGSLVAVRDLSCTIEDGEFVVFVGPSGCGKTTTLRLIAGFEEPDRGEIRIDGRVVNDLEPRDRGLGMVFQSHALFPHKTVAQNIEFGLRMKKVARDERARRVREVAEMVRLADLLGKMPGACSGGEAQRVALARTLVTNPSTFLLDEPLSSLDAKLRRELRAECDRLHQELKKTFIYVTHDQEEAMTLADRIVVMRAGQIEQIGSPMEIYSSPATDFVADFFGSPSMNLIAGEIIQEGAGRRFHSMNISIALPDPFSDLPPGAVSLGIRPENVVVQPGAAATADLHLPVRLVEPLGKDTLLYFELGAERPFVAVSEGLAMAELEAGDRVGLTFARERIFVFGGDGRCIAGGSAGGTPVRMQLADARG
jgi:ABC-type sugar transport system ATPase subunit